MKRGAWATAAFLQLASIAHSQENPRGPIGSPIPAAPTSQVGDLIYYGAVDHYVLAHTTQSGANGDMHLRAVHAVTGAVAPSLPIEETPVGTGHPSLCWNPGAGRFLVVCYYAATTGLQIRGLILDGAGQPYLGESTPFPIGEPLPASFGGEPFRLSVACDGDDWMVGWGKGTFILADTVYARKVLKDSRNSGGAQFAGPAVTMATGTAMSTHMAYGGSSYVETWSGANIVAWKSIARDGTPGLHRQLSVAPNNLSGDNRSCVVGLPSGEFVLFWPETRSEAGTAYYDLKAQRTASDGAPVDGPVVVISTRRILSKIAAAWSEEAEQFLVAWLENAVVTGTGQTGFEPFAAQAGPDLRTSGPAVSLAPPFILSYQAPLRIAVKPGTTQAAIAWTAPVGSLITAVLQRYDLGPSPMRPRILDQVQRPLNGGSPLAAGATTKQAGVAIEGRLVDPGGNLVRLELEIQEAGQPFTGTANVLGSWVPSDTLFTLRIPLARNTSQVWQSRIRNLLQKSSRWSEFGSNAASEPDVIIRSNAAPSGSSPSQVDVELGQAIPAGGKLQGRTLRIEASSSDPDAEDLVRLELQIRRPAQSWAEAETLIGPFVPAGVTVSSEFSPGEGGQAWRWRVTDDGGDSSAWSSFGGNEESTSDFTRLSYGSVAGPAACGGASGGSAVLMAGLLLGASLNFRRIS